MTAIGLQIAMVLAGATAMPFNLWADHSTEAVAATTVDEYAFAELRWMLMEHQSLHATFGGMSSAPRHGLPWSLRNRRSPD